MMKIPNLNEVNAGRCGCGCGGALLKIRPSKRGQFLHRHQYDGRGERFGYRRVFTGHKYVFEHVLIAEKALGKSLPDRAVVHHHDQNKLNNANHNLVICETDAYHSLLHKRMRVLARGGDPEKDKWCCGCKGLRLKTEFGASVHCEDGMNSLCRKCVRARPRR